MNEKTCVIPIISFQKSDAIPCKYHISSTHLIKMSTHLKFFIYLLICSERKVFIWNRSCVFKLKLTLLPNKNANVTVVVKLEWINITRYKRSGFAGNGSCKNILKYKYKQSLLWHCLTNSLMATLYLWENLQNESTICVY